jgi:hypothetical protein
MTAPAPTDELYAAPLAEFVATRDRLAADLVRAGRKGEGQALKKLRRPSASAWATNQVVREARAAVDEMLAASDRLRRSQDALLAGRSDQVAYQEGVDDLRRATAALGAAAREVLGRAGRGELVDGVIANVRVAGLDAADGRQQLLEGRLTVDLEAGDQGLAALLGTGARADGPLPPPPPRVAAPAATSEAARREKEKREEHARRLAAARSEAASAREVSLRAETAARTARAAHEAAAARVEEAERALSDQRDALRFARKSLDDAEKHAARVAAESKAAADRLDALEEGR